MERAVTAVAAIAAASAAAAARTNNKNNNNNNNHNNHNSSNSKNNNKNNTNHNNNNNNNTTTTNNNNNAERSYIDPAELFGAMDTFRVPATDAEDLVDFFQICDPEGAGAIDYRTWLDIFDEEEGELDNNNNNNNNADGSKNQKTKKKKKKQAGGGGGDSTNKGPQDDEEEKQETAAEAIVVIPRDANVLRKIITSRRQQRKQRQRDDRLRLAAQQQQLDKQIYRDELATAAAKHKEGSNPKIFRLGDGSDGSSIGGGGGGGGGAGVSSNSGAGSGASDSSSSSSKPLAALFHYYDRRLPVRHQAMPKDAELEFEDGVARSEEEERLLGPILTPNGYPTRSIPPRIAHCCIKNRFLMCTRMSEYGDQCVGGMAVLFRFLAANTLRAATGSVGFCY